MTSGLRVQIPVRFLFASSVSKSRYWKTSDHVNKASVHFSATFNSVVFVYGGGGCALVLLEDDQLTITVTNRF